MYSSQYCPSHRLHLPHMLLPITIPVNLIAFNLILSFFIPQKPSAYKFHALYSLRLNNKLLMLSPKFRFTTLHYSLMITLSKFITRFPNTILFDRTIRFYTIFLLSSFFVTFFLKPPFAYRCPHIVYSNSCYQKTTLIYNPYS